MSFHCFGPVSALLTLLTKISVQIKDLFKKRFLLNNGLTLFEQSDLNVFSQLLLYWVGLMLAYYPYYLGDGDRLITH